MAIPNVSVIIPTYNRAKFVTKAIDSVLAQTYSDYEIMVVDDGSTDNTREVLVPYMDKIIYIYQENAGVSAARNTGIRDTSGQWIAFLDSDDEWLAEKLAIQMADVQKRPELCGHITNATFIRSDKELGNLFEIRNFRQHSTESFVLERPLKDELSRGIVFPSSFIVRRDTLLHVGLFDTRLSVHEDRDLFFRVALQGPWGGSPKPLVRLLRREEPELLSLSWKAVDQGGVPAESMVYILERIKNNPQLTNSEGNVLRKKLSGSLYQLGIWRVKNGSKQKGRSSFKESFLVNPSFKSLVKYMLSLLPCSIGVMLYEKWVSRRPLFRL